MTVSVRPAPPRVASNGIVPFRQVQYANKVRPVPLKDWKPPVPEPLKPAPLLGLAELAALGVGVIAHQVWGLLNPNRSKAPAENNTTIPDTVLQYQPGTALSYQGINEGNSQAALGGYSTQSWYYGSANNNAGAPFTDEQPTFFYRQAAEPHPVPSYGIQNFPAVRWRDPRDGQTKESWLIASFFSSGQKITIRPVGGDPAQWLSFPDATTVEALNLPDLIPNPEPTATPPAPLTLPLPSTVPRVPPQTEPQTLPAPSPLVPVTPGPVAPPIVRPSTPISPQQPKVPAVTGTTNDGRVIPVKPGPVVTTNPNQITPWPGAAPIPGTGLAPRPTLQGIAQEVGRIERKLEVMMNPTTPGNLLDKFGDLKNFIGPLIEAILSLTSGTTYQLDSPCEIDASGNRLPAVEVQADGALNAFGVLQNRLDALAELLQVHKDLKQPNCRQKPPSGEFVTVNFEQID